MTEKAAIHDFVQDLLLRNEDRAPLVNDGSLLVSGRLQSIDTVEIVIFLEENFNIDFSQIGFDRDQLDSVDAIYALIQSAAAAR
ncbi:MAG TPA: hypothetical protein VHX37_02605 [Acidobacteriaceae bacterium]|jgi:acyl carrier protein|nr:hypothetical protein [Acidobacteriaceae bacterium]